MANKKTTALVVRGNHVVAANSNLAKKERLLLEAVSQYGESFFRLGVILQSIKEDEDWKDGGYTNFNDYCDERQPCGFKRSTVKKLIAAARVRHLLPDMEATQCGLSWTENSVRPLTHKEFQPSDVRRIGKKILTRVKKEKKLTAEMVKAICDDDRGVERKKRKKMNKALQDASIELNIGRIIENLQGFRVALEMYPDESWDEVEETNPQLVKSLIRELDLFASFLKE